MRVLERLGIALGAVEREVLALVAWCRARVHIDRTISTVSRSMAMRSGGRREVVAVGPVLVLVPAGPDPPVEPPAADDVDVGRDLGQQCRVAVRGAAHHLAEAHPAGPLAEGRQRGPALEHRLVRRDRDVVEVVVDPERVVAERLGQLRNLDGRGPLGLGALDAGQLGLPALGHERPERDRPCGHAAFLPPDRRHRPGHSPAAMASPANAAARPPPTLTATLATARRQLAVLGERHGGQRERRERRVGADEPRARHGQDRPRGTVWAATGRRP